MVMMSSLLSIIFIFNTAFAQNEYFFDHFQKDRTQVILSFSSHTESSQDNELKRLDRILKRDVTKRQISQLVKQIERKLEVENEALELELFLVNKIEKHHTEKPFEAILGEFSIEMADRYQLRINTASFIMNRLYKLLDIPKYKIDNFILLLTGEDVFPLLEGNFLAGLPIIPTEKQQLLDEVGSGIGACKGMMGVLALGQSAESQEVSKLLESFYLPQPAFYPSYLRARAILKKQLIKSGSLRLRLNLKNPDEIEQALVNCDYLFDQRRDDHVVKVLQALPPGKFLLTRGLAHRWLLQKSLKVSFSTSSGLI
jgi:hypothetical protein